MYEEANKNYKNCGERIHESLVKQAKTICNPNNADFIHYMSLYQMDTEFDDEDIKEKITEV